MPLFLKNHYALYMELLTCAIFFMLRNFLRVHQFWQIPGKPWLPGKTHLAFLCLPCPFPAGRKTLLYPQTECQVRCRPLRFPIFCFIAN